VFPFESDLSAEQLRAHVIEAIRGLLPFPLHLQGITGHEGEHLLLNVKRGNDELIELHDRLYTGTLPPYLLTEYTYVPHLTVGRLNDRISFLKALGTARTLTRRFQIMVSEVTVYRLDDERPIEYSVELGTRPLPLQGKWLLWHSEE
jgi:2'-5' RNA ligase